MIASAIRNLFCKKRNYAKEMTSGAKWHSLEFSLQESFLKFPYKNVLINSCKKSVVYVLLSVRFHAKSMRKVSKIVEKSKIVPSRLFNKLQSVEIEERF